MQAAPARYSKYRILYINLGRGGRPRARGTKLAALSH
jgi:hypothetical protein